MDDRWNSSDAFKGDFRTEFLEGLALYLRKSGFAVEAGNVAVQLRVTINHFEGRKRVNNDGGDLGGVLTLSHRGEVVLSKPLFESLTYEDESDESPAFAERYGLESAHFATVLFYRLSVGFYASIVDALLEAKHTLHATGTQPRPAAGREAPLGDTAHDAKSIVARQAVGLAAGASGVGFLTIGSTPTVAEVYLDDKLIATTPAQGLRLPTGSYFLRIRKAGYLDWARELMVLEDSHFTIEATLEKESPSNLLGSQNLSRAEQTRIEEGILDEIVLKVAGRPAHLPILLRPFSTEEVDLGTGADGSKESRAEAADMMRKMAPDLLMGSLKSKLLEGGRFMGVLDPAATELPKEYLILEGKFLKIDPGSRAKRYWVGYGAGKSGVKVTGVVTDAAGNVLAEFTHMRHSGIGLYGGEYLKFLSDDTKDLGADIGEFLVRWTTGGNLSEDD